MATKDMRNWMAKIEKVGELRRIKAEVDWNLELGAIARLVSAQEGPALLFENIKGYKDKPCHQVFINGLASQKRVAMALGLPRETGYRGMVEFVKERLGKRIAPVVVKTGPVKENIVKGNAVNLYDLPVPQYNKLDGGRYINTYHSTVTIDPDKKLLNVGTYRGMIGDNEKSIPVLLARTQHWGIHLSKYERRGEEMPVAVVYGWDPTLFMYASAPVFHPGCSEYDLLGALRGEPVELVKCETSEIYVPASAEIVVEGKISSDPKTYQMEGPFGEYTGFYGGFREPKPTIRVECITYRNNPVFRAGINGASPGRFDETTYQSSIIRSAIAWKALEDAGVPNILGVWGSPIHQCANLRVQIDKVSRGHAKQVAAALWGISNLGLYVGKNVIVVDKDIDVFDESAVEWALAWRTNAAMDAFTFFPGSTWSMLDTSIPLGQREMIKYGGGKCTRVLIDATVNWDLQPEEQYGGRREPPLTTIIEPEVEKMVRSRWSEYGL